MALIPPDCQNDVGQSPVQPAEALPPARRFFSRKAMMSDHRRSSDAVKQAGVKLLLGLALTAATQSTDAASAQELTKFTEIGNGTVLPNSNMPKGCQKAGTGICSSKIVGTSTSTLVKGVNRLSGISTLDFTKPAVSAGGICFPQIVTGREHTSRGDFKFVLQGQVCIPPASAGLSRGVTLDSRWGVDLGGTGDFAHLSATLSSSGVDTPSGFIFRVDGSASGI